MDTNSESLVPRALVPHAIHTTIDAILKDLKICSRRIHQALDYHADEVQLLNRVYYKSKNQHRGALFWRRLVEIRRYNERLDKAKILSTLDEIRTSFFGPEAKQNPKHFKGPWTHSPQKKLVAKAFDHLQVCRTLLLKMQERLLEAYRSFTLGMQSGAFVQLLVVLAGMASRIRMLCTDLDEALCMTSSSLKQFLNLDDNQPLNPATPVVPDIVRPSPAYDETAESKIGKLVSSEPMSTIQVIPRIRKGREIPARQRAKNVVSVEGTQPRVQKKVKSRKPWDEIDEIFSFKN